jgi:proline dehydrogenase
LKRSRRHDFKLGVKLVRGAYMVQERDLAEKHGYKSPIFDTIESTHANFNECVGLLLDSLPNVEVRCYAAASSDGAVQFSAGRATCVVLPCAVYDCVAQRALHSSRAGGNGSPPRGQKECVCSVL